MKKVFLITSILLFTGLLVSQPKSFGQTTSDSLKMKVEFKRQKISFNELVLTVKLTAPESITKRGDLRGVVFQIAPITDPDNKIFRDGDAPFAFSTWPSQKKIPIVLPLVDTGVELKIPLRFFLRGVDNYLIWIQAGEAKATTKATFKIKPSLMQVINKQLDQSIQSIAIGQVKVLPNEKEVKLQLSGTVNPNVAKSTTTWYESSGFAIILDLYKDGHSCLKEKLRFDLTNNELKYDGYKVRKNFQLSCPISYLSVFAGPGNTEFTGIFYFKTPYSFDPVEISRQTISFTQPQLLIFDFESKDLDVDVSGKDISVGLAKYDNKKSRGLGFGDLVFSFDDAKRPLYTSAVAKNSGTIKEEKGHFLFFSGSSLTMYFMDNDVLRAQYIDQHPINDLTLGTPHHIQVTKKGKIYNLDLNYSIYKLTDELAQKMLQ